MTSVMLRRGDLRPALAACLAHAGRDDDDTFGRIRIAVASSSMAVVSAIDGYSAGVAAVAVHDLQTDELPVVDLPLESVHDVLAVFKPPSGRDERAMWDDESLRVDITDEAVTWTEAGAFMEGKALTVPRIVQVAVDTYPDVPRFIRRFLLDSHPTGHDARASSTLMARFVAAAKVFGAPLVIRHTSTPRGLVILAGPRFIGVLTLTEGLDDPDAHKTDAKVQTWRDSWAEHLAPLVGEQPAAPIAAADEATS
jgi:hypothetical protein